MYVYESQSLRLWGGDMRFIKLQEGKITLSLQCGKVNAVPNHKSNLHKDSGHNVALKAKADTTIGS